MRGNKLILTLLLVLAGASGHAASSRLPEAQAYLNKALGKYEASDYATADTLADLAVERERNFKEAYWLKGLIAAQRGDLEAAERWRRRGDDADGRLSAAVAERLGRELRAMSAGVSRHSTERFTWQVRGDSATLVTLAPALEAASKELAQRWGLEAKAPIPVTLFSPGEVWQAWQVPFWMSSFDSQDGAIRLRSDEPSAERSLIERARHQLVHAALAQTPAKAKRPRWFEEGLAAVFASTSPSRGAEIDRALQGATLKPLDALDWAGQGPEKRLAALESEAAVRRLLAIKGDASISALLQALGAGDSFEKALQRNSGMGTAALLASPGR